MKRIAEVGFYRIVLNHEIYNLKKFIGFSLVYASKLGMYSLVTEICTYLNDQDEEIIINVLHHKDEENKTALYYANKNDKFKNGVDLIRLEKVAHKDHRLEALMCIRTNAGKYGLELLFLESYKRIHPLPQKSRIVIAITSILTLLPSIIFFYLDFASDIALCRQYYSIAIGELNKTNCPLQLNYETCFKHAVGNLSYIHIDNVIPIFKNILSNETCHEIEEIPPCEDTDNESMLLKYKVAFVVMMISILVPVVVYIRNMRKLKNSMLHRTLIC